ncbi:hypothetical protein BIV57_22180 [Mangrovactinospora gilvigrisea]|uniref:Uncharacterized protein n=2 Tax=Mangrovactinospora gilvigrisea TaxID=1428644 RepID=A0A1J7B9U2_9ACTN|nr:hypothetical protein BIV57_22180 [Mangrovactinospora gilvigrisea]
MGFVPVPGGVRSLVWRGEEPMAIACGDPFDRAIVSPSGRFTVVYEERGTTALLRDGRRAVRELARSDYHAGHFDFPVALGRLPDGREVLVHCPEEYNVLQVEELATERRLTAAAAERAPVDVFHSRLAVGPDGRHLLSAGWIWHPYGIARVYDLARALDDAAALDGGGVLPMESWYSAEVAAACWLDADRVVVGTNDEVMDDEETEIPELGPRRVGVWSLAARRWLHRSPVEAPVGHLLAAGGRVVSLYGWPRLIDPVTGRVLGEWPDVGVARKDGSFGVVDPTLVAAVSPDGARLAVGQEDGIAVLELG